jgi:hypothetical protein
MNKAGAVRLAGAAISVACLFYFLGQLGDVWRQAESALLASDVLRRMVRSWGVLAVAHLTAALGWVALLRCFGVGIPARTGGGVYLLAQFAKYLPGNVGHYVGRVVLGTRHGIAGAAVIMTTVMELVLLIAIAVAFSLPLLDGERFGWYRMDAHFAVFMPVLAGVVFVVLLLLHRFDRSGLIRKSLRQALDLVRVLRRPMAAAWFLVAIVLIASTVLLTGLSLLLLGVDWHGVTSAAATAVLALYSATWVVGTLAPGVPAGLGIREVLLTEGLAPLLGQSAAVTVAVLFRLVTTLGDAGAATAGWLILRRGP